MPEEGFRVATAYVALTVEDGDVKAQIEQVITDACEQAGQEGGSVLTEQIAAKVDEEAGSMTDPMVTAMAQAGAEAAAAFDEEITPEIEATIREMNAGIVEQLGQSGGEGGAAFGETFTTAVEELEAQVKEQLRLGLDEAAAQSMAQLGDAMAAEGTVAGAAAGEATGAAFEAALGPAMGDAELHKVFAALDAGPGRTRGSRDDYAYTMGLAADLGASRQQLDAWNQKLVEGQLQAARTTQILGGLTAAQNAVGESAAVVSSRYAAAQETTDRYGISEAQLAVSSAVLSDAQATLADENVRLVQIFATMGNLAGSEVAADFEAYRTALADVADAQASVTSASMTQVDAMNAVNLAVIQNETALRDDQAALEAFLSASQATGMELADLTAQLEEADYATLNKTASDAKATIQANLLTEAEQKLAAANITLIDIQARVAAATEVSAEEQTAALKGVAAAQREVAALGGAGATDKAAAGAGLGMMMGGGAGMLLWNLPFMIPMITQAFGNSGQAAQAYQQQLQSLGSTIAQDGGQIGANTEAALANQIAYSSLSDSLEHYGVSLTQTVQYASGVAAVQGVVNAQLNNQAAALEKIAILAEASRPGLTPAGIAEGTQAQQAEDAKKALESLAKSAQVAVEKQNEVSAAVLATEKVTGVFTGQVKAAELAMSQQAETADVNAAATQHWIDIVVPGTDQYAKSINDSVVAMKSQAQQTDITAYAQQQYLTWLVPGTDQYIRAIQDQVTAQEMSARQADITAAAQEAYLTILVPGTQAYTNAVQDQVAAQEMNARTAAIAAAAQEQYLQALLPGTVAYTQAVQTQQAAQLQSADQAALTAMAELNLGNATTQQQQAIFGAVDAYTRAAGAASGYKAVLDALNGTALSADQAQNTLAQDMLNAKTSFAQNSYSLDLNTQAGITNRQALVAASQAIEAMGIAQYQSTGNMNSANNVLQQQIDAYVKSTGATGKAKDAIIAYLEQITKIPPNVSTMVTVTADTQPAMQALSLMGQFAMSEIASINNTPITPQLAGPGLRAHATGGPVQAGVPVLTGDGGRTEVFIPTVDGRIYPTVDDGARAMAKQGWGGGPIVHQHFYGTQYPTVEQTADMYRQLTSAIGAAA